MEVEQLAMPKRKAEEEYQALKQAFKQNTKLKREVMRQDLKKVYGFLRHGKTILDLQESFKKAGLNKEGHPKLAIVKADSKVVICEEHRNGSVRFYHDRGRSSLRQNEQWNWFGDKYDVVLPEGTFEWLKKPDDQPKYDTVQTVAPIIPAKILVAEVKVLLKNFHILWEVEEWKPAPPRDPILLKKLTPNLYGILATWNLTKLERAVIRGRIE